MNWVAILLAIILIILILLIPVSWIWKIAGILIIIILAGAAWAVLRGWANNITNAPNNANGNVLSGLFGQPNVGGAARYRRMPNGY